MQDVLRKEIGRDHKLRKDIAELVGSSFPVHKRIKYKGLSTTKFHILNASEMIQQKLGKDKRSRIANIDLRPGGILISFRSGDVSYNWILPFDKFELKMLSENYEIRTKTDFMIFENRAYNGTADPFLQKIVTFQNDFLLKKSIKDQQS